MRYVLGVLALALSVCAQDPTATLEGRVTDPSGAVISGATVKVTRADTGAVQTQQTTGAGTFSFSLLPAGSYEVRVESANFTPWVQTAIPLSINQTARLTIRMQVAGASEVVMVEGTAALVEMGSNTLGNVVSGRELVDLPLNGRNFTQLGLLQPGVAPITAGIATAGGSLRSGQAYAVNGQRPESNSFLLDGTRNVNRVDSGYVLRTPVDAIQEFRILTETAPAEYGGSSGATTTVVTRSGSNALHGDVYEFLRNDKLDSRNFFSEQVEPLKQNQFGATAGGPIRRNRDFFFAYYEGFRNRQGITKAATVPTAAQREGDFSGLTDPQSGQPVPLINYFTGQPFPGNRIPESMMNPVAKSLLKYYPEGNLSPSLYSSTEIMTNRSDQGGGKLDHVFSERDQASLRYAYNTGSNVNPLSIKGADVPGFPVGDDLATHSVNLSETHSFGATMVNSLRAAYFRHSFLFDKRLNRTSPRELGFNYDTTLDAAQGPPFFIVNGYASIGDPITGPRDTVQNTFEIYDGLSRVSGAHGMKFGVEFRRTQINSLQGIASNGFFVFAPFPASDSFASFLLGSPVVFFQAGGQLGRGLRNWDLAGYAQDEWRVTRNFTLNYGLRYEISTPFGEIQDRLNAWAPGRQSTVFPDAPAGLLFPGDKGVDSRIAPIYWKGLMPRAGFTWDPTGSGKLSLRAAYGIFYDSVTNGTGAPLQAPLSALPWTQARQLGGPGIDFTNPWQGNANPFAALAFPVPSTVLTIEQGMRPPYAQNWNFSVQRSLFDAYLLDLRYVGNKGTRLPRMTEANPSVYRPGASSQDTQERRLYPENFGSVGLITDSTNSTYHAAQLALSRRFRHGLGFLVSYWYSNTLDYVSSFNVSGSAPRLVGGENDLAQNPFDLRAEHGPSLFDARHRFVASGSYELPSPASGPRAVRAVFGGWQLNAIATVASGTPFTVYDSANVSLQGSAPEISGFYSSRPDVVADPNRGPHTADEWVSRSAFRRLDPVTEAGRFGNAGRNIVRGPGISNVDLSLLKTAALVESVRLQFRAECFNIANHANLGLPANDLASPNFGRILESGPPRLFQFGLKLIY
ncbi:MAG TPA: carboxypeptidase regulatory-like domain-containing protein [Bryobacteraceae bacterium]|nr:carboxypeptidase regulatory-like domain-containing protein [Bryobacteraceae bacterium]